MLNGLYVATSGLMMQNRRVENIANNLANVNTTGFKKDVPVFTEYFPAEKEFPQNFIRSTDYNKAMNSTVKMSENKTDFSSGYLRETGGNLDFAISDPNSFFAVDTPFGIRFTRSGDFTINENSELVTAEGYPVLSNIDDAAPQPIVLPENFTVTENGIILADGEPVDQLGIAYFENTDNLQKVGHSLYAAVDVLPEQAENPGVTGGYLEGSNVNAVLEMVRMIDASRSFETYQKVIQSIDSINGIVINTVGKLV
jgi:flagellar basal-body rod protein FlgG